jgi:predicted DNA-binding transcriptional regulator AlpA
MNRATSDIGEEALTTPEVCRITRQAESAIYQKVRRGEFPEPRRLPGSKKNLWLRSEIRAWLENLPTAKPKPANWGDRANRAGRPRKNPPTCRRSA